MNYTFESATWPKASGSSAGLCHNVPRPMGSEGEELELPAVVSVIAPHFRTEKLQVVEVVCIPAARDDSSTYPSHSERLSQKG